MSLKSCITRSAPPDLSVAASTGPVATATDLAPAACAHATSSTVSPTTMTSRRRHARRAARLGAFDGDVKQMIPIRYRVAIRAAAKELPQIEMLELDARAFFAVTGQESREDVAARVDRFEQIPHAGKHTLCRDGARAALREGARSTARENVRMCRRSNRRRHGRRRRRESTDPCGPPSGMPSKASGIPKRSSNARFIARLPARPVRISVPSMSKRTIVRSRFRTHVARARAFRRRFFVEGNALAFGKLIEASLDAAAMEEPLLSTFVTDKSEAAISYESFDRALRHGALLRSRSCSTIPAIFSYLAAPLRRKLRNCPECLVCIRGVQFRRRSMVYIFTALDGVTATALRAASPGHLRWGGRWAGTTPGMRLPAESS